MLDSLHIKNFRCFEDLTIPSLGRVNLIVGKNSVGKTTLLEAVNIFATKGDNKTILEYLTRVGSYNQDFSYKNPSEPYENLFINFFAPENKPPITIGEENHYIQIEKNTLLIDLGNISENIPTEARQFLQSHLNQSDSLEFFIATEFPNPKNAKILSISEKQSQQEKYSVSFIHTNIESPDSIGKLWDEILLQNKEASVIETLKIIDNDAENLFFITPKNKRIAYIKKKQASSHTILVPLESMGEGITRILQIFLHAHQAVGGFLLVDEFENGLHYSIQEEVWEKLFKLAKDLDIQVFATTHSEDTIKAFCKVSLADDEVDGKLISLGRSAYGENKGKIMAIVHGEPNDLQYIIDTGMETR